jgi:adenylyl-sulfate kinase
MIILPERIVAYNQCPAVLWLTGLSGSGKSTIAERVEDKLFREYKCKTYILDGDKIRKGLNSDLGFSPEDRKENIRRISEVSNLFADAGFIVIVAFISPFREDRDLARKNCVTKFIEVYVECDIQTCIERDPKGLYKKALVGEIKEFTGLTSPYEIPSNPEISLKTDKLDIETCSDIVVDYLRANWRIGWSKTSY